MIEFFFTKKKIKTTQIKVILKSLEFRFYLGKSCKKMNNFQIPHVSRGLYRNSQHATKKNNSYKYWFDYFSHENET